METKVLGAQTRTVDNFARRVFRSQIERFRLAWKGIQVYRCIGNENSHLQTIMFTREMTRVHMQHDY